MSKALHRKFNELLDKIKSNTCDHPSRTNLIQALEEAALLAEAEDKGTAYHIYLDTLHTHLDNAINGNTEQKSNHIFEMVEFIRKHHESENNKFAPKKWKAVLILVVAALEFIVLALALSALLILAGAGIFGAGFLLAGMCFTVDPTILQIVALAGAFLGAVCGIVGGIVAAAELTSLTVQAMKTSEWAGFEAHDSLWDLAVNGATKTMSIDKKITTSMDFFSKIPQHVGTEDNKDSDSGLLVI